MRRTAILGCALVLLTGLGAEAQEAAEKKTVKIGALEVSADCPLARKEHPRIFLTRQNLPELRARCMTVFKEEFAGLKKFCEGGKADVMSLALVYLITEDRGFAEKAKQKMVGLDLEHGSTAVAFDWIYDSLTPEEVEKFARMLAGTWKTQFAGKLVDPADMPWSAGGTHAQLLPGLVTALALYGEGFDEGRTEPVLENRARCLREGYVPGLNAIGHPPEGFGWWHSYVDQNLPPAMEAWRTASGEDLWKKARFAREIASWYLLCRFPHADFVVNESTTSGTVRGPRIEMLPLLASRAGSGIAQSMYLDALKADRGLAARMGWRHILWYDAGIPKQDPKTLPTSSLLGDDWVVMRSGWDKDATFAFFSCGDRHAGHQHMDVGHFIITRKAFLAIDSGFSMKYRNPDDGQHQFRYYKRSIAHNTIAVYDPHPRPLGVELQQKGNMDDGGQVWLGGGHYNTGFRNPPPECVVSEGDYLRVKKDSLYDTGDILAYEDNKSYTYCAGDCTKAYRRELIENVSGANPSRGEFGPARGPKLVEEFTRQFLYLKPDLFLVFDRVRTAEARYTKSFVLHTVSEPTVQGEEVAKGPGFVTFSGNEFTATDGDGKLFSRTLYPHEALITRRGGLEVTEVVPGKDNKGDGGLKEIEAKLDATPQKYTITCVEERNGGATFEVRGSLSGELGKAEAGKRFTCLDGNLGFLVAPGKKDFARGDSFEFEVNSFRFWSAGENREPNHESFPKKNEVLGRIAGWGRIEVEPKEKRTDDVFLHVLHACDQTVEQMVPNEPIEHDNRVGAKLTVGTTVYEVTFNKTGPVGGHIKVTEGGKVIVDRELTAHVEQNQGN